MLSRRNLTGIAAVAITLALTVPVTGYAQDVIQVVVEDPSVTVPPVDPNAQGAPGSLGILMSAINNPGLHAQRLNRLTGLEASEVTLANVDELVNDGNRAAYDNAISRTSGVLTASARSALTNHSVVMGVLNAAGISPDRVVGFTVLFGDGDVTVFYR